MGVVRRPSFSKTRKRKLANNTYLNPRDDGSFGIRLHSTDVVVWYPDGSATLHTGGWATVTTKQRINEFGPANNRTVSAIHSDRGVWMVGDVAFADGMRIHADGRIEGAGVDPRAQQKLRKRIKGFARDYMDAFYTGDVSAPGAGDCFFCQMKPVDPHAKLQDGDHILSHMEESYYVPSLLARAAKRFGVSRAAEHTLACVWTDQPDRLGPLDGFICDQLRKALTRYCYEECGLSS